MNRFRRKLAAILAIAFVGSAHAQSDPISEALAGVSSSFHPWVHDAVEYAGSLVDEFRQESIRLHWLANSDIRMRMVAHDEGTGSGIRVVLPYVFVREAPSDDELYAEFDWQNQAMSMSGHSSAIESSVGLFSPGDGGVHSVSLDTSSDETNFTMYFDANSNVYVPADRGSYVKVNMGEFMRGMFDALEFGIDAAIDSRLTQLMDYVLVKFAQLGAGVIDVSPFVPDDFFQQIGFQDWQSQLSFNDDTNLHEFNFDADSTLGIRLRDALRNLIQSRYELVTHFPLVNFAFLASPIAVRNEANNRGVSFDEEPLSVGGQHYGTQFTLTSGDDAGYVFAFDRYNRLIYLQDTDGSWASYEYDRDVSVQLPTNILNVQELMRLNTQ